jgi:formyl-CoA transferase
MIESVALPDGQALDLPGIVPKLSETPGRTVWVGPTLGAHLDVVLSELGISAQTREALRTDRVI